MMYRDGFLSAARLRPFALLGAAPLLLLLTSCQVVFGLDDYTEVTPGTGGGGAAGGAGGGSTTTTTGPGGGGGSGGGGGGGGAGCAGQTLSFPVLRDTFIESGSPDANYGADNVLKISDTQKTLMYFDIDGTFACPDTAIQSAKLQMHIDNNPGSSTVNLYVITQNMMWLEGASTGQTAAMGEPTWNRLGHPLDNWAGSAGLSTPNVDYVNSPNTSISLVTGDLYEWDVTPEVTAWANTTAPDYGFLLVKVQGSNSYQSPSKNGDPMNAPVLQIELKP